VKIGRTLACIATAAGLVGGGAAAYLALRVTGVEGTSAMSVALGSVVSAALVAAATLLLGYAVDRRLGSLRRSLLDKELADALSVGGAPHWLRPLVGAVVESRQSMAQDTDRAVSRLREMEIRHRISESEREQIATILNGLRDAVLVTDPFDELIMANEPAARLFGFDLDRCVHTPIDEILHDEALSNLIRQARESATPSDRRHVEYVMSAQSGEGGVIRRPAHYDVTIASLACGAVGAPGSSGGAASGESSGGLVTILRDVTREKEISQMKSDFVSQVSHELRTPLSSINAYVEMLVDGEAKDEASRSEFYQIIKNEADRLGRLIDNMLNISRIEAGIVQVERSEVDFVQVAREAIEVMQPQAKLKNISLITKAGPLVYTAQADRDMIHQVVLNLVSNAVKYTPENGRVTVSIENDDATRSVMIAVSDTGLGIPPDDLGRIFDKFYRIDNYKRVAKGTGLGLNLVKHIVETVHMGQVGVSSKVGMGSRFWFTIPFVHEGRAAA